MSRKHRHKLCVPGPSAQVLWAERLRSSFKLVYQATLGFISMSQVTGRAQLLRAPGVSRTGQAPFRRVCASTRSPHSVSHVNRRAALIAAGLISTVQALAAEEKPTSEKYATEYPPWLPEALTVFVTCQEASACHSKSFGHLHVLHAGLLQKPYHTSTRNPHSTCP